LRGCRLKIWARASLGNLRLTGESGSNHPPTRTQILYNLTMSDTLTIPLRREGETLLIGETKLPLELVLNAYLRGSSAEQIATRFVIPVETVYALIAYYHQNKVELNVYLKEQEKKREVYSKQIEENTARMGAIIAERKAQQLKAK
jgi:uncharacterized protein (DUF433 family)